jgi:uncharacterized membrane protein HdeD (DUF308 family)
VTAPLDDDPFRGLPTERNRVVRDVAGILAVLVGLIALAAVLASVDLRLAVGLGAVVLIAGGLWLGRDGEG